jgi:hypothetical protein
LAKDTHWTAVEKQAAIQAAVNVFEKKFAVGASRLEGFPHGPTLWHETLGVWGHFSDNGQNSPRDSYWNVFGQQPIRPRANMLVEINPPGKGKNTNRQGVVATAEDGHRWILHQGRLHPGGIRVTEAMFDAVAAPNRRTVRFSDGSDVTCVPIADLDGSSSEVRKSVAVFVALCAKVRAHYQLGEELQAALEAVDAAEEDRTPEKRGSYALPPLPARTAKRQHADIWAALDKCLDRLGVLRWTGRFGRYGPDMFAKCPKGRVLFEIKPDSSAASIHSALGQLNLYQYLSGHPANKVMVLPELPPAKVAKALQAFGVDILLFSRRGRGFYFDDDAVRKALAK